MDDLKERLQDFSDSGMWKYKGFMFTKEDLKILLEALEYYKEKNETNDCTSVCDDETEI